ncbi:N-acetylglutamate synthase, GNAT family [Cognatiyoonia koreensis]|uniref:N-acetylglutamate synthase, GNAT family n=1 Tax=Cognatiyoonia koreensis TaxID=364200 RepID=A0A1I0RPF6_9RHOB|nr:GNAT family N-acetyltransferase [Cognatiyoonia koreensis]SEW42551.1 N-acetylglutamate synthase, GNAT family [Cognatiyoonia koreensis]
MSIRKATKQDAARIAEIHQISRETAMPWLPVLHTPAEDLWFYENLVIPDQDVEVHEIDGVITGFSATGEGWLHHLYVDPAYWKKGVGALLLLSAQARNKELYLWVFQQNQNARDFYSAHGFKEVEFTDGQANEEQMADLKMHWTLSPGS